MKFTKNVETLQNLIKKGNNPNDIAQNNIEKMGDFVDIISCSDGFWYGLTDGGYIKLNALLEGDDLVKAEKALAMLEEVYRVWQNISIEF